MAIFKPQPLEWDDIKGGIGERVMDDIESFICDNCYDPPSFESDEDLSNEHVFFGEQWDKFINNEWQHPNIRKKACAIISLIYGAFIGSWVKDNIMESVQKSATKKDLINLMTDVSSLLFQYYQLFNRVEKGKKECA